MAFLPINFEEGQLINLPMAAATYTIGQALTVSAGYYQTAVGLAGTDIEAVCMEAGVVASSGNLLKCISTRGVKFLADTDGTPAYSQQGTTVDIASATTVDEDGFNADGTTTDYLFYIEKVVGPLANKKVQGYFKQGTYLV